ncbi:hypothetical protein BSKO_14074 [Bryopsis sp. KO-2023]|nr:hypothetical protein BSKO_14074 [Bryopsis sp. KO-2023]
MWAAWKIRKPKWTETRKLPSRIVVMLESCCAAGCWSILVDFAKLLFSCRNAKDGKNDASKIDWGSLPADIIESHLVFRPLRSLNRHWRRAVSNGVRHANLYPGSDLAVDHMHQCFPSIRSLRFHHALPIQGNLEVASACRGLRELGLDWPPVGESSGVNMSGLADGLTRLVMHSTGVTDNGCQRLVKLTNLRELSVISNKAGALGFSTICSMVWLTSLAISQRQLLSSSLTGLTNLSSLDLYRTGAADRDAHCIAQLTKLTSLGLGWTYMGDVGVAVIAQSLTNLVRLNLRGSSILDESCSSLATLPLLQCLTLANTRMGNLGCQCLTHSSSIAELDLSLSNLDREGCSYLSQIPQLTSVSLARIYCGGIRWGPFDLPPSLVRISLCHIDLSNGSSQVLTGMRLLTSLSVEGCIHDEMDCRVLRGLTDLVEVNLHSNSIGDRGCGLLRNLTKLTRLDVGCTDVGDRGCFWIARLTGLRWLNVDTEWIGDAGMKRLAGLKNLTYLHHGPKVTYKVRDVFPFLHYGVAVDTNMVHDRVLIW